jgi:hypothetical protein
VTPASTRDYIEALRLRYARASRTAKAGILTEVCATTGYHRKSAIRALTQPPTPYTPSRRRGRPPIYTAPTRTVLIAIWEAASYPWSARLQALVPLWLPWARRHFAIPAGVERQLRTISPRTMDRVLQDQKRRHHRHLYGRTKPGALLKHHIPIKAERWTVTTPGFVEVDLVSHSGNSGDGTFLQSLNLTDIHSTWVETRAVLGKGQRAVRQALEEMAAAVPFPLRGLDSDNGSEFINDHLLRYCQGQAIQFTRGRPYKKDDNAHIEQKNWTHVRKLLGWARYDSPQVQELLNELYRNELRLMMNLFQPSVKLLRKIRVGSRLRRKYDRPQTPLDRLLASPAAAPDALRALQHLREGLDPFVLAKTIEAKLVRIHRLANHRQSPQPRHPLERQAFRILARDSRRTHTPARAPVT